LVPSTIRDAPAGVVETFAVPVVTACAAVVVVVVVLVLGLVVVIVVVVVEGVVMVVCGTAVQECCVSGIQGKRT